MKKSHLLIVGVVLANLTLDGRRDTEISTPTARNLPYT